MKIKLVLIALLFCSIEVIAQNDSTFLTNDLEIQTRLKPNDVHFLCDVNCVTVTMDSLLLTGVFENLRFSLKDVKKICIETKTHGKQGVIYGGSGGFVLGFVGGLFTGSGDGANGFISTRFGSGLLTGVIAGGVLAVVGAMIGENSPVCKELKFGAMDNDSKRASLLAFLRKYKIKE